MRAVEARCISGPLLSAVAGTDWATAAAFAAGFFKTGGGVAMRLSAPCLSRGAGLLSGPGLRRLRVGVACRDTEESFTFATKDCAGCARTSAHLLLGAALATAAAKPPGDGAPDDGAADDGAAGDGAADDGAADDGAANDGAADDGAANAGLAMVGSSNKTGVAADVSSESTASMVCAVAPLPPPPRGLLPTTWLLLAGTLRWSSTGEDVAEPPSCWRREGEPNFLVPPCRMPTAWRLSCWPSVASRCVEAALALVGVSVRRKPK